MRRLHVLVAVVLVGGMMLAGMVTAPQALAATPIEVADGSATYPCTRDGLAQAITDVDAGGTVTFDCADPVILFGENAGNIVIDKAVTINGSNSGGGNIVLDAQEDGFYTNFFEVPDAGNLTLQDITLQNGGGSTLDDTLNGGAIEVLGGSLTTLRVSFIGNRAFNGGAIDIDGGMATISESRFERNIAFRSGGAIDNGGKFEAESGTLLVSQSTFDRNRSSRTGGAITSYLGTLKVVSSTFTRNLGFVAGSTLDLPGDSGNVVIAWSTIVQAGTNEALWVGNGVTPTITGVIFGGNGENCNSAVLNDTYSISNDETCGLGGTGSSEGVEDLGLGPLMSTTVDGVMQSYYPLLNGSPAINGGSATCDTDVVSGVDLDQVGQARPNEGFCDIGAFESDAPPIIDSVTPTSGLEGQEIVFDPEASQVSYPITWQLDCTSDGEWDQGLRCTYPDNGSYEATFMVVDGLEVGLKAFTISIANVDPMVDGFDANPRPALTGQVVTLSTTASDVEADPLIYSYHCGDGELVGEDQCLFERGGSYQVSVTVEDGDQGSVKRSLTVQVYDPVSFCVNDWNGAVRIAGDCRRSEHLVSLPLQGYEALGLCVNDWNGATRVADGCGRSEHTVQVIGQDTVSVCVNRWNGVLRVSGRCSRSERQEWI